MGLVKPDRVVFEDVVGELGVPARETVFLDDNAVNVDRAAGLGFDSQRVQGPVRPPGPWPSGDSCFDVLVRKGTRIGRFGQDLEPLAGPPYQHDRDKDGDHRHPGQYPVDSAGCVF
jgi:hypothetical protein